MIIKTINDIKNFKIDLIIVCTPTSEHLKYIKEVIKLRTPVLIEKPLSNDLILAKKIVNLSQSHKHLLLTGHMYRFHPAIKKLRKLLSSNFIGKIKHIDIEIASYLPDWHKYESYKDFYASQKKLGGGVVLTESHEIDLLIWLFGKPYILSSFIGNQSSFKMDVEDTAISIINYKSSKKYFNVSLKQSFVEKIPKRFIRIFAEKGILEIDFIKNELTGIKNNKKFTFYRDKKFDRNNLFSSQLNYIVNLANNRNILLKNKVLDNGLETLEVLNSIKKSSLRGKAIKL